MPSCFPPHLPCAQRAAPRFHAPKEDFGAFRPKLKVPHRLLFAARSLLQLVPWTSVHTISHGRRPPASACPKCLVLEVAVPTCCELLLAHRALSTCKGNASLCGAAGLLLARSSKWAVPIPSTMPVLPLGSTCAPPQWCTHAAADGLVLVCFPHRPCLHSPPFQWARASILLH